MIEMVCEYAETCTEHIFPDDWQLGGPAGTDPRLDPRFQPRVYIYLDRTLHPIHTTVTPLCLEQAIDEFTKVANFGPGYNPVYLQTKQLDRRLELVDWQYDADTDYVFPLGA